MCINDLDSSFEEGDTLLVKIGETETDDGTFDARDEQGNELADSEVKGAATTEAHTFYDNAFNIALVSSSATVSEGDTSATEDHDSATFKIVYDVTAFGSTIYLGTSTSAADTATAEHGVNYDVLINGSVDTDATSTGIITMSNKRTDSTTGAFEVRDGETRRFTLTVQLTATEDNFYEVQMESLGWSADTDATADANTFTFSLDEFDAGPVYMETN